MGGEESEWCPLFRNWKIESAAEFEPLEAQLRSSTETPSQPEGRE